MSRACAMVLRSLLWMCLFALLEGRMAWADEHSDELASRLVIDVCARCHGLHGDSASPLVPRLAAQRASYLTAEILDLRTHKRDDAMARAYMQGRVTDIDQATAQALARYYARQPPVGGTPGNPEQIAKGKALFEQGSDRQVACVICHGAHAEGVDIFPRLAGQHAAYLQYQLKTKQHDPHRTSVMHGMIDELTEEDMANLVTYLESLH